MSEDALFALIPIAGILCGALGIVGWMFNNWLRARHGYPLADKDGKPMMRMEDDRRVDLLTGENDRLKGALLRLEERVAVLERIATDQPSRLSYEIESLRAERTAG